jgi:hypothetical protein
MNNNKEHNHKNNFDKTISDIKKKLMKLEKE